MLLSSLFPKYLDSQCFKLINGGKEIVQSLLESAFGHILFTGGTEIGKEIMKAAAKHLTPVTLELGGRNSVVVTADLELAATRILWAKFAIAGQTCFAPNQTYATFYSQKNDISNVGHIINRQHWDRIKNLMETTKGKTILRGTGNPETLFATPTIIVEVPNDDPLVRTEIFGPILPILTYSTSTSLQTLLRTLSPSALAFYVFGSSPSRAQSLVSFSGAGTAAINDVMAQIAPTSLPFGGVGGSGYGAYRGKASIETFSYRQSTVSVPTTREFEGLLGWRYPQAEGEETVAFVKDNLEMPLNE